MKNTSLTELAAAGIVLFALYLAFLYFRSGLSSVASAIVTGLVVILIEILLIGFSRMSKRIRRARSATRSLAKTSYAPRRKKRLPKA